MSETKRFPSFSRRKTARNKQTDSRQTAAHHKAEAAALNASRQTANQTVRQTAVSMSRNEAALQKIRHPFFAICVCLPFLLPDFYLWQTYYAASGKSILKLLYAFGLLSKVVSMTISCVAVYISRKKCKIEIPLCAALFFMLVTLSGCISNLGSDILRCCATQIMLCVSPVFYFPSVFGKGCSARDFVRVLRALRWLATGVAAVNIAVYALYPHGFGMFFNLCEITSSDGGRLCGVFVGCHTDTILYGLALILLSAMESAYTNSKAWLIISFALSFLMLYFSQSATAKIIAVLAMLPIINVLFRLKDKFSNAKQHKRFLTSVPLWVINIFFAAFALYIPTMTTHQWFINMMNDLGRDTGMTGRVTLYETALEIASEHPILGVGYSQEFFNKTFISEAGGAPFPHNSYLQILVECGTIGMAVFCIFIYLIASDRSGWNRFPVQNLILQAVFIGALISGSFTGDFFVGRFYFILALIYCGNTYLNAVAEQNKTAENATKNEAAENIAGHTAETAENTEAENGKTRMKTRKKTRKTDMGMSVISDDAQVLRLEGLTSSHSFSSEISPDFKQPTGLNNSQYYELEGIPGIYRLPPTISDYYKPGMIPDNIPGVTLNFDDIEDSETGNSQNIKE